MAKSITRLASLLLTAAAGLAGLLLAVPAYAYLGPGAGLGMIGSLIAIVFVLLIVIFGLIVYPIRRMRKRRTKSPEQSPDSDS